MKTLTKLLIAGALTSVFSLANAGALNVWNCTLNEGKTSEDLMAASQAWLAAAKAHPGGEGVEAHHTFPVVAGDTPEGSFLFVSIHSDFEAWGKATEAYPGSAVAEADEAWGEVATCSGNKLWYTEQVE